MVKIVFTPGRYWPRNGQGSGEIYKEISLIHPEAVTAPGYNRGTSGDGWWVQSAAWAYGAVLSALLHIGIGIGQCIPKIHSYGKVWHTIPILNSVPNSWEQWPFGILALWSSRLTSNFDACIFSILAVFSASASSLSYQCYCLLPFHLLFYQADKLINCRLEKIVIF